MNLSHHFICFFLVSFGLFRFEVVLFPEEELRKPKEKHPNYPGYG